MESLEDVGEMQNPDGRVMAWIEPVLRLLEGLQHGCQDVSL